MCIWRKILKHAFIITWSGFQDHEFVYLYYRLLGDDFKVSVVADKKDSLGRVYGIFGPMYHAMCLFLNLTKILKMVQ